MTQVMSPENAYSRGTQTIQTSSGKTRTFEFESWTANQGERSLTRYTQPAAIRGQAFLMLNHADDIWTYFPRTKRVRKLASSAKKQKVQGSDFTYEDMGSGDVFIKKFTPHLTGMETMDGEPCFHVELKGIPDQDPPYPLLHIWVRVKDFSPLKIDYYNDADINHKSLILSDIQVIDGYPTAMTMVMTDHLERSSTRMTTLEASYTWTPTEDFFSQRNLKQCCAPPYSCCHSSSGLNLISLATLNPKVT